MNSQELIQRYLLGEVTSAEVRELDRLLANDPRLRSKLILAASTDAGLREIALERMSQSGKALCPRRLDPSSRVDI